MSWRYFRSMPNSSFKQTSTIRPSYARVTTSKGRYRVC